MLETTNLQNMFVVIFLQISVISTMLMLCVRLIDALLNELG